MSYVISKAPLKLDSIVGQDLIWSVLSSNANAVGVYKFKYVANIYYGDNGTAITPAGVLKFSPNANGVGIIDVSQVLEQYLGPDFLGNDKLSTYSTFKGTNFNADTAPHPIHCIDNFSLSNNACKNWWVLFGEEFATTPDGPVGSGSYATMLTYGMLFNATDYGREQNMVAGQYGVALRDWRAMGPDQSALAYTGDSFAGHVQNFLTNAPSGFTGIYAENENWQLIGDNDYGTLGFLAAKWDGIASHMKYFVASFYSPTGAYISGITTTIGSAAGGFDGAGSLGNEDTGKQLQYWGIGTANLQGMGYVIPTSWDHYRVQVFSDTAAISPIYIYKRQEECKGFEKVRLAWLNKFGVWDYYN